MHCAVTNCFRSCDTFVISFKGYPDRCSVTRRGLNRCARALAQTLKLLHKKLYVCLYYTTRTSVPSFRPHLLQLLSQLMKSIVNLLDSRRVHHLHLRRHLIFTTAGDVAHGYNSSIGSDIPSGMGGMGVAYRLVIKLVSLSLCSFSHSSSSLDDLGPFLGS